MNEINPAPVFTNAAPLDGIYLAEDAAMNQCQAHYNERQEAKVRIAKLKATMAERAADARLNEMFRRWDVIDAKTGTSL